MTEYNDPRAIHESMMSVAKEIHKELCKLLQADGLGTERISKSLETMLFTRVFDNHIDEIRYFVHTGNNEDAMNGLTFLSTMIEDHR